MSGNVWEWCLNKYDTPDDAAADASVAWRVLRGGSWFIYRLGAHAAYRLDDHPVSRDDSLGFRVVCVRAASL